MSVYSIHAPYWSTVAVMSDLVGFEEPGGTPCVSGDIAVLSASYLLNLAIILFPWGSGLTCPKSSYTRSGNALSSNRLLSYSDTAEDICVVVVNILFSSA